MRLHALALVVMGLALSLSCKARQDGAELRDVTDTDSIVNNYDGTFRVRCADGKLHNGKKVVVVTKQELKTVCEQNAGGGGGDDDPPPTGGGNFSVDACQNAPAQVKQLNLAFAGNMMATNEPQQVQQLKFCNGFVQPFGKFLSEQADLQAFLTGTNPLNSKILVNVGPQNTAIKYHDFGMLDLPWDIKPALPNLIATMRANGASIVTLFMFSGVRNDVKMADLKGWERCFLGTQSGDGVNLQQNLLDKCTKSKILVGCGPAAGPNLSVAAIGGRASVFKDTGQSSSLVTTDNGVDFYFNMSHSLGFVKSGAGTNRSSCDTATGENNTRLCWHTTGGGLSGGYKCGNANVTNLHFYHGDE